MRLLILSPRFIKGDMRGGEEVVRYIYNGVKEIMDTYIITSDGLDVRYQHSIFSRSLRNNRDNMIIDSHILYLRSFPLINMVAKIPLKLLETKLTRKKDPFLKNVLDHIKVIAHGPYLLNLRRVIRRLKPDLIWGSIYPNELSVSAFYISKDLRIPFIYTPYYHYQVEDFKKPYILRKIVKEADFIVANTQNEERELISLGCSHDKIRTINLGIESKMIPTNNEILMYKRSLGLTSNFIVLTQAWTDKGAIDILKAIADYSNSHNDVTLLTIGEPDEKYLNSKKIALELHKKLTVIDLGWVETKQKMLAFASSDVFVMLSKNDAFGLSYLDAFSMKVPVIAMKGTTGEDIVTDNIDGFLVSEGDIDDLKAKLDILMNEKELKKKLGENGLRKVKEKFNSRTMIDKYAETFLEIIQNEQR